MIYGLDICAGSGIGSLAFEAIGLCRTVCYVERDTYCQQLLRQRMQDGWLAPACIWDDLRTFDGRPWRGLVDFVFGGIPCQPHSLAGKRGGAADERDLWPDFWRVVCEVGPRLVLVENVPGMLSSDGGTVMGRILGDLAEGGYDAEWDCIPAAAVGAPHRRDRVWVVAYSRSAPDGQQHSHEGERRDLPQPDPQLADATGDRQSATRDTAGHVEHTCQRRQQNVADTQVQPLRPGLCASEPTGKRRGRPCDGGGEGPAGWWEFESDVDRVADGVAARVDRLRTIGNGWVPQVAAVIAARIGGF